MAEPFKLQVRLGQAEFSAEGQEGTVKEQFALFLEALRAIGAAPTGNGVTKPKIAPTDALPTGEGELDLAVDPAVMRRVFVVRGDTVSLNALPRTEQPNTDTLTLLLYGYMTLQNAQAVSANQLIEAARQSGLQVTRIDRSIDPGLVLKAGLKRGTRYSLNNRGMAKAKELLTTIFE